jgi:hypothetical protein
MTRAREALQETAEGVFGGTGASMFQWWFNHPQ